MKRTWPKVLVTGVAIFGVGLLTVQATTHIPPNAGGAVDVEANMEMIPVVTSRPRMLQRLSQELKQHPQANRFRVTSLWGDCGISGRRAIVYDRSTNTLLTWLEGRNKDWWFSKLSRVDYANVSESSIHTVGNMDRETWFRFGRKSPDYDVLLRYGGSRVARGST
jgi:hypothetical protein